MPQRILGAGLQVLQGAQDLCAAEHRHARAADEHSHDDQLVWDHHHQIAPEPGYCRWVADPDNLPGVVWGSRREPWCAQRRVGEQ